MAKSRRKRRPKGERQYHGIDVSDHAIVRYMERVAGMDIEKLKEQIAKTISPAVKTFGNGRYPCLDGIHAVVEDNIVVTMIGDANG